MPGPFRLERSLGPDQTEFGVREQPSHGMDFKRLQIFQHRGTGQRKAEDRKSPPSLDKTKRD